MSLSKSTLVLLELIGDSPRLGDLKKIAKGNGTDHDAAIELWSTGGFYPRLLAILLLDRKRIDRDLIDRLAEDIPDHSDDERSQLSDWLLINQLFKSRKTAVMIDEWEHEDSPVLRRIFWYYQAKLRWNGKTPPGNTSELLNSLESDMAGSEPEVQWTMNYAASQIGIHETEYRSRCLILGERLGLYADYQVPRGCTSPYLPEWINTEVAKLS